MAEVYTLAKNLNIAKLVQPDVSGLLKRDRLFELLDKAENGFAWVMGPAGSGKTSLLTSWAHSRNKNILWYRVDIADSDPATFFHYFSLALGDYGKSVPAFSVEHIPNLEIFARRYFRACFQALPKDTVIIFDNCHAVSADDALFLLINWLLEERVPGSMLVCSSRQAVPSRLNPWQVMSNYAYIGWESLLGTEEEASDVARLLGYPGLPKSIYDYTGGWLAGLVLQLKVNHGDALDPVHRHDADHMAVLFSVFAEGAFNSLNKEQQQVLLANAFAPRFSPALAAQLSENERAGEILFQLHRSHFFIERSILADGSISYVFHPLLKAFLKENSKKQRSEAELKSHYALIAHWLETQNEFEDALELWVLSENYQSVVRVVSSQAPVLIRQGQIVTFFRWLTLIPPDIANQEPSIHYWKGMVLAMTSPPLARMSLQLAYNGFLERHNLAEALLAACAALESYFFEWGNWKEATYWIDLIASLVEQLGEFPSLELEIRVISAAFAFIFPCPNHPLLAKWAARAETLISTLEEAEPRLSLSIFLITYHFVCGEPRVARSLAEEMSNLALHNSRSPIFAIALTIWCGTCLWREGESELAIESLNRTLEVANHTGIHQMDFYVYCHKLVAAQGAGDSAAAEEYFKLMQANLPTGMGAKQFFTLASSGLYLMRGDLDTALHAATEAIDYFNETGWGLGAAMSHNAVALFAVLKNDFIKARQAIAETTEIARHYNSYWMMFQSDLLLAACCLKEGDEAVAALRLKDALQLGREKGFRNYQLWWAPDLMAELFAFALENDIETAYITEFINRRKLVAPANAGNKWPWPLRITTLGGFCIYKNGVPIKFERKAQKRILEVIKAIAAAGGKAVSLDKLSTQLWEDADGDKAHNHCYVAIHRARNLLELDQSLIVSDGKVSFNPDVIWFDVWELNRISADLERNDLAEKQLEPMIQQLNSLYLGAFLEGDNNEQWVLEKREKLANRFFRAVSELGECCEKLNQDALAVKLYGGVLDQLAPPESIYLRLMQCHQKLGHFAEALAVYERFERRLTSVSKRAPSAKIKALRDQLEKQVRV